MANQGIIHLAFSRGGKAFCNTRRSIMSTTVDLAKDWPDICKKCSAVLNKRNAKKAVIACESA